MTTSLSEQQRDQYRALTTGSAWCEWPGVAHVRLSGADRASFLHNLCTNDIKRLQPGQGCEAFLTNVQGKIVVYALVYCETDSLWLDLPGADAQHVMQHLDRYLIREDVQLEDGSGQTEDLLLAGPHSRDVLRDLAVTQIPDTQIPDTQIPDMLQTHTLLRYGDHEFRVRRSDWIAAEGFQISAERDALVSLHDAFATRGVSRCDSVREMARLERGSPVNRMDVTESNLPQEVDRDSRAISFVKGCYLGQETVARIDALGHVNWKLRGILGDQDPLQPGQELKVDGVLAARVTSAGISPRRSRPLALAYVRRGHEKPGTELRCESGTFTVVELPLEG